MRKYRWWTALSAIALTTSTIVSAVHTYPVIANPQTTTKQAKSPITLSGHTAPIRTIALSADGQTLASGDDDKTIKVWNLKSGELRYTLTRHTERISSVAISPDGKTLITASHDRVIKVWDIASGKLLANITGHKAAITAIAISPDGKTFASASMDQTVRLWNTNNRRLRRSLQADAFSLVISPDGKTLFSGSNDGTIKLWNLSNGKVLRTLTPPLPKSPVFPSQRASRVLSLAISPNGQTLVNGGYNDIHQSIQQTDGSNLKIWDLQTRKIIHNFSVGVGSVDTVVISPDGKTFASGGLGRKISIFDLQTGKLIRTLEGHAGGIYALAFSRDGKTLISGSGDKSIKVWQF
ncbi:WD40 repeat domain-containing protein [Anabaena azotica]|uniref:WD40 repeat domain-containing protein n=1 Tax=Anabaena azotica FACHB-119 TaxID=947527 RepID=A0ABR8CXR2_9NOST|nr:WD40 repeat domain-containing protein [Anabaena azotica]MBD2499456.1 WD40 repeat domain-containing protein [Anabaena azotica FACHB-119]